MKRRRIKKLLALFVLCCFIFTNYSLALAAKTVTGSPKKLKAVKVKETSAVLKWKPAHGKVKVKKYIIYSNNKVVGKTIRTIYNIKN